ncbi:hypothetical protein ACP275_08G130400 [Erythranthe tilingii]
MKLLAFIWLSRVLMTQSILGQKPEFRLDYFGASSLDVNLIAEKVTKGIINMCQQSDCTLLEGEGSRIEWPFVERTNFGDHLLRYMKASIHKLLLYG